MGATSLLDLDECEIQRAIAFFSSAIVFLALPKKMGLKPRCSTATLIEKKLES
ncbi:hypothetical protein [Oscillatoria salina]|uniref:hypothetical protein n=1 Tax=Oscillatoria salina TaxID=331517 RepID=UPI0013B8D4B4|nr:hypothetical protein [Oscillatoria salina]MBZ8178775.1 hypothetical protein [Oscillatoria salina IIICB1]NET87671.1 hypothetical protein [Kamptonema sp. SIO1D9]